jgi:AcrR family transcriptional regulator
MPVTKPGERKQQILEILAEMLERPQPEKITTAALAARLDVSEAALYRHFASKKDILLLLIEDIERTLLEAVDQAASDKQDPIEGLENVLKAHLSYLEQRRGVSLLVIAETLRLGDKDLRKRMFEVVNRYMGRIEELLASGVKSGQVSKSLDLGTAALTFFALVHATVTLWALSNAGFSLAKRHKPLWKSYLAGIAIGGPEGG